MPTAPTALIPRPTTNARVFRTPPFGLPNHDQGHPTVVRDVAVSAAVRRSSGCNASPILREDWHRGGFEVPLATPARSGATLKVSFGANAHLHAIAQQPRA